MASEEWGLAHAPCRLAYMIWAWMWGVCGYTRGGAGRGDTGSYHTEGRANAPTSPKIIMSRWACTMGLYNEDHQSTSPGRLTVSSPLRDSVISVAVVASHSATPTRQSAALSLFGGTVGVTPPPVTACCFYSFQKKRVKGHKTSLKRAHSHQ